MLDPDLFNMIRFTIAAIPFVPFLLKSLRDMQVFIRGVELGIWVTFAYVAQSIGLVTADAGRASFISALTVRSLLKLSRILYNVCSLFFTQRCSGDHRPFLGWYSWSTNTCHYVAWCIFINCWGWYSGVKWFSALCKSTIYMNRSTSLSGLWMFLFVLWPIILFVCLKI